MMTFIATDDGQWVSEKYERLQRVLQDYSPTLELRWIPSDKRTRDDKKPYQVVNREGDQEYIVCHASELDSPEDILATVLMADNTKGNLLDRIDAHNRAQQIMLLKQKEDELLDRMDILEFMLTTPLHYIKMGRNDDGKLIKFDDQRRRI